MPIARRTWSVVVAAGLASAAQAAVVPVSVVAKQGDALDGSTITGFSQPFVNGLGLVGFTATLADSSRSVWYDSGSIFNSSSALPDVLSGSEANMGISNTGGFIYSPSFNGDDAVYTHDGLLLKDGDAAPGMPGFFNSFNSRPRMLDNGDAVWVGGFATTSTGSSIGRVLYRADPANPSGTTLIFKTGDSIGGFAIGTTGVGFDFDFSGNGIHHIHNLLLDTGSTTNDGHMWVNGSLIAREGSSTGQGDNWSGFKSSSINNSGNYIFAGDTDGPTATDDFIAYNGSIALRQGSVVDGVTLANAIDACAINNKNEAAFVWDTNLTETLFWAPDASNLAGALALLSVGDLVDVDGDMVGDFTLVDFNASTVASQGMDFGDNGYLYLSVDLRNEAGVDVEAIISIYVPAPGSLGMVAALGLIRGRRRR